MINACRVPTRSASYCEGRLDGHNRAPIVGRTDDVTLERPAALVSSYDVVILVALRVPPALRNGGWRCERGDRAIH